MTVAPSKFQNNTIQLSFFIAQKNSRGAYEEPRPFELPSSGFVKLGNAQLESAFKAIATLARSELRDSYKYGAYLHNPCSRVLTHSSFYFLFGSLLATECVYVSKDEFIQSMQEQKPMHLLPARFVGIAIKVQKVDLGYSMTGFLKVIAKVDGTLSASAKPSDLLAPIREIIKFTDPNLFRWNNYLGYIELSDSEQIWFDELASGNLFIPDEDSEAFFRGYLKSTIKVAVT